MIHLADVTKLYGALTAVDHLSFAVAGGEVVGLIGPNGAGKTTTLRCVAGIQRPSSGVITIAGHDIVREPIEAKRQLAFIPDEPQLFDYLTVTEHLRLIARLYQVVDADARIPPLLAQLELDGKRTALPTELSRGMRQKLALGCALLHRPTALLFDEPLTGLDPLGIRRIKQTILACARDGAAVVVSSHLLHLVEEICSRIVIIAHGRKLADGTLGELSGHPGLAGADLEQIFLRATGADTEASDKT
ncbi:MAG: ABC transporter ATP-binding protein [Bacteroidales bacterium]